MEIHPGKGVLKKRSFQTPGNTLTSRSVVSLGTSDGNITKRKINNYTPQIMCLMVTLSGEAAQTLASTTSKQGLDSEVRASLLRVRTRHECHTGNLRELT